MHSSLKIIKNLLYSYFALHVSGTLAPIFRSFDDFKTTVTSDRPKLKDTTNPTTHGDWRL